MHNADAVCPHPADENAWISDDVFICCACGQKFPANDPELIDGDVCG